VILQSSRDWTIDVHALRHTLGTLLSKGNVAPRTAQAAMRHSSLDLTMNVYTDPQLLDVAGALERLPELRVAPQGGLAADRGALIAIGGSGPACGSSAAVSAARTHKDRTKIVVPRAAMPASAI
jgi:hypothetical protein